MSRIGKQPISLAKGVSVNAGADGEVEIKGPLGTLRRALPALVSIEIEDDKLLVNRQGDGRRARANHGLTRSLLQNMVTGVSTGFKREMRIEGVGYRAEAEGKNLKFNVGYSTPILFELPEGISVDVGGRGEQLTFKGIDKEVLGETCAKIRAIRPPEPYKGKGIRFVDERVRRKAGKQGVA